MPSIRSTVRLVSAALLLGAAVACGRGDAERQTPGEIDRYARGGRGVELTGAGASLPFPVYARWFARFGAITAVRINYQSIGSGGGIRQLGAGTVDFGATDVPLTPAERAVLPGVLQIPTVVGAISVAYNLPPLGAPLRLDAATVADLFLGRIARWDHPRLAALNPGVALPPLPVLVVHRTDGSGSTRIFTGYAAGGNAEFRRRVGVGKSVRWPAGLGAKGNEGVAGQVERIPGAIGYVEYTYARIGGLPSAALRNRAGVFVEPSVSSVAAAAGAQGARVGESLLDVRYPGAYPLSTWTYLLVPSRIADCARAGALRSSLRWALLQGDAHARALHYAPVPPAVQRASLAALDRIGCGDGSRALRAAA